jgi:KH domain
MSANDPVELLLDLRAYSRRLEGPLAFLSLWDELTPTLKGKGLALGKTYTLESGSGAIQFTVMRNPVVQITDETRFAVHSLLEPPALRYTCKLCQDEGKSTYGPFICSVCRDEGDDARVCDNHVVILDGAMRSFCRTHAPRCDCGSAATFWCQGVDCRRRKAWCDVHRQRHRNDPDHSYCNACFARMFPECERGGCDNVGTLECEFVDARTLEPCRQHACPIHMHRWQVYGPDEEGLALCSRHSGVRALTDEALIAQIILGTAGRRRRMARSPGLPTLQSVRHILRKARGRLYDLGEIARLFEGFNVNLGGNASLRGEVTALLGRHAERRQRDIQRDEGEKQQGLVLFEKVRQLLVFKGQTELAAVIRFSDYRPRLNKLFIVVPQEFIGRFVGTGGRNIKELSASANVDIGIEKTGQQRSGS